MEIFFYYFSFIKQKYKVNVEKLKIYYIVWVILAFGSATTVVLLGKVIETEALINFLFGITIALGVIAFITFCFFLIFVFKRFRVAQTGFASAGLFKKEYSGDDGTKKFEKEFDEMFGKSSFEDFCIVIYSFFTTGFISFILFVSSFIIKYIPNGDSMIMRISHYGIFFFLFIPLILIASSGVIFFLNNIINIIFLKKEEK